MKRHIGLAGAVVFGLVWSGVATAQGDTAIAAGTRVRITSSVVPTGRLAGTLTGATSETLFVADSAGRPVAIPLSGIRSLDLWVGHRSGGQGFLRGLGYGAGICGLGGALIGLASGDDPPDNFLAFSATEKAALLGLTFGVLGGVVGGIAGAAGSGDIWRPLVASRVRVAPVAARGRTGWRVGVSLAF